MQIEFENKFVDLLLFHSVHQFLSPVVQGLIIFSSLFFFYLELASQGFISAAITALCWFLGLWLFQLVFNAIYLFSKKNVSVFGKRKIELLEDGLLEESNFNKSLFYWHGVQKAVSRPGFVAIYTSNFQAHIIPNKYFESKTAGENFLALVKEKISVAALSI